MKYLSLFIAFSCALSSCAYMQTHKNVSEIGTRYVGAEISTDSLSLYSRAGEWYLAAPKVLLERHYPIIYDTIYLNRDNDPTESVVEENSDGSLLFMPISAGTAKVLQRQDGYAELASLLAESRASGKSAVESLPGGQVHTIHADIETKGQDTAYYVFKRIPERPGRGIRCLSQLDKYSVDAIGTVVYNVAIPFMAPFRFFSEFFTED